MHSITRFFIASAAIVFLNPVGEVSAANLVINGSMTGTPAITTPPPGWTSVNTDGDTIPVGGLNGWATDIGASPDGGTFLAILNNGSGGAFDATTQYVYGFTVGLTYTLEFSYANIGLDQSAASNYANSGFVRANIAGIDFDTPVLTHDGFGSQQWFHFSETFIATAPDMYLTFTAMRPNNAIGGYAGGIDGVFIAAVPEPSTIALLSLGIVMIAGHSRRRNILQMRAC